VVVVEKKEFPREKTCGDGLTPRAVRQLADMGLEDALAGYVPELTQTREILDSRYDDLKSGRVKPIDGEAFFETLRQREYEIVKQE